MGQKGIDVSSWQKEINWKEVKNSGIQFAIIRATYGLAGTDAFFVENMIKTEEVKLDKGVYHYCYAQSKEAARQEAEHFLKTIKGYHITYPVALDLEDASIAKFGKETITEIAYTFLETVRQAGYYPILYTSLNWTQVHLDMARLKEFDLWLAQWREEGETYPGEIGIWQYADDGKIAGIHGFVDLDEAYKNYPVFLKENGWNHLEQKPITWEGVSLEQAIQLLEQKAELEERTIQYLKNYRFYDVLIRKLGAAIIRKDHA